MRFVCDSCRAQYMISDDKVGPKGVKVRCKKCGFVILVRRQEDLEEDDDGATRVMSNPLAPLADQAAEDAASDAAPTHAAAGGAPKKELDPDSLFGDDDEDEIGAIFDSVLNSGSHSLPGLDAPSNNANLAATRALDVASMAKAMDQSVTSEEGLRHELTPALPSSEWYVAIEDKQVGPVGIDTLKGHWDRGEVGPDSLCWRAGMADWIPLADVAELQRHLVPKASKPVIVAPASVSGAHAASHDGFSGAAMGSIPGASAADPAPGTGGGWKPSAASALASLVKDELDVLARPAPAKRPEGTGSGLLDVPASLENPAPAGAIAAAGLPQLGQLPAPELAPGTAPATYAPVAQGPTSQPAYTVPPYVAAPAAQKKPIALYVGGAVLLVALAVGATALIVKPDEAPPTVGAAVPLAAAPAPVAQPVAAAPVPAPAVPVAAPVPPPVAELQPDAGTLLAVAAAAPETEKAAPEPKEEEEEAVEPSSTRRRTTNTRIASASRTTRREEPPEDTTPPPVVKSGSSDPFDDIFGDSGSKSAAPAAKTPTKTSTYVPPAPGGGDSVPAELAQSDIMQVVLGKRSAIVACATQAKASIPRWPRAAASS